MTREGSLTEAMRLAEEQFGSRSRREPFLSRRECEEMGKAERLALRRRRAYLSLTYRQKRIFMGAGSAELRGRPHGHAPRNTSRISNGRTRRPTRRATSARRTSRSGARSSPSDSSDDAEPADEPALQLDLDTFAYGRAT